MSSNITTDTIEIPLSKTGKYAGKYMAVIDAVDADLAELNWFAYLATRENPYAARNIYSKELSKNHGLEYMHRVILERQLGRELSDKEECDHIDGNRLNNRRDNLRACTHAENNRNKPMHVDNKLGYKGVMYTKRNNKYRARIKVDGKQIHIGYYLTPEEAHEAYCKAAEKYHGEFARF